MAWTSAPSTTESLSTSNQNPPRQHERASQSKSRGQEPRREHEGVLIKHTPPQTPSAIQAWRLLSQLLPHNRRAMVGTDRLAGPPKRVHQRGLPVKSTRINRLSVPSALHGGNDTKTSDCRGHGLHDPRKDCSIAPDSYRTAQGYKNGKQKEKTLRCLLSLSVAYGCAMKCGGGPTQPTYPHLPTHPLKKSARTCVGACTRCGVSAVSHRA